MTALPLGILLDQKKLKQLYKGMWLKEDREPKPMKNAKLYTKRHIIERFFGKIKDNKLIATRFDKLDNFLPIVHCLSFYERLSLTLLTLPYIYTKCQIKSKLLQKFLK